ncbi:hypothetical protein KRP22_012056 [Phytophthora ramorum]|nr:hypothetical protein KRP22_11894 [Phytophthora ramorum]
MTAGLRPLPGVSTAVHAAFPALTAIPQVVEAISSLLDYSALWNLEDASSIGDLRLVKRIAAHDQRRLAIVDPPPSDLARRAAFTAAVAEAAEEGHLAIFQWLVTHYAASHWDITDAMILVKVLAKYCDIDASADSVRELATARRRAETELRIPDNVTLLRARRDRMLYSQRILDGPAEEIAVWYDRLEVLQFLFSNGMVSKNGRSRAELATTATARGYVNVARWLLDFTTDA